LALNFNGRSKGFAHVEFAYRDDVSKAIRKLNGAELDGRALRLDRAEEMDN